MKRIVFFLLKWVPKEVPKVVSRPVGRWKRETCDVKTEKKIDNANYDHCGPCGQYKMDNVDAGVNVGEKEEKGRKRGIKEE
jgi:hypothetical protein